MRSRSSISSCWVLPDFFCCACSRDRLLRVNLAPPTPATRCGDHARANRCGGAVCERGGGRAMSAELPVIWAGLLAFAVFAYVVLDGFDLGTGILFLVERDNRNRDVMVNTIAPVWDGNETWLVLGGGGLFAAFPLAYAVILPALYYPLMIMLLALVLRGV